MDKKKSVKWISTSGQIGIDGQEKISGYQHRA